MSMIRLIFIGISIVLLAGVVGFGYVFDARFQPAQTCAQPGDAMSLTPGAIDQIFEEKYTEHDTDSTYGLALGKALYESFFGSASGNYIEQHFRQGIYGKTDSIQVWNEDKSELLITKRFFWYGNRMDSIKTVIHAW